MKPTKRPLSFGKSGYYFLVLFALVIAGLWPSYFEKFFDCTADFTFYLHFHAT